MYKYGDDVKQGCIPLLFTIITQPDAEINKYASQKTFGKIQDQDFVYDLWLLS